MVYDKNRREKYTKHKKGQPKKKGFDTNLVKHKGYKKKRQAREAKDKKRNK